MATGPGVLTITPTVMCDGVSTLLDPIILTIAPATQIPTTCDGLPPASNSCTATLGVVCCYDGKPGCTAMRSNPNSTCPSMQVFDSTKEYLLNNCSSRPHECGYFPILVFVPYDGIGPG